MPVIPSDFKPPWWLRNPHAQTIAGACLRHSTPLASTAERLELPDGDFVDLSWTRAANPRVAILSHGLEGSTEQGYVRGMSAALAAGGWDALAWNYRGCGAESNRLPRFYHSGATEDLDEVVTHAARTYSTIALIGFSLGGNLTLKYLGESIPNQCIVAAAAISAPIDLAGSARQLDSRRANRLYLRRFIRSLVAKVEAKALRFPANLDASHARKMRTFAEFDDRYTAPLHGFRDAEDYWKQASARQYLGRLTVPALLINAYDDPFLSAECFPISEAKINPNLFLEAPIHGGHLGFLELTQGTLRPYYERRILEFFTPTSSRARISPEKSRIRLT